MAKKQMKQLMERLQAEGFTIGRKTRHWTVQRGDGPTLTIGNDPQGRAYQNTVAAIKREYGVDPR